MAENKDYKFVDHYESGEELLKKAFVEVRKIYKEHGFVRKMGSREAPAITTVDMAKAWMSERCPFICDHSEEVCTNALKVLEAGRKVGAPIFHIAAEYVGKQQWGLPRWDEKIPMSTLDISSEWLEINPKLKPFPEEPVTHKKCASNFFRTHLIQTLNFLGVDILIVVGAASCACVRHTVTDPAGCGFKTTVPEGIVGDRTSGVVEWNLFDVEARFADAVPVDEAVEYLERIDPNVYTKYERSVDQ